MPATNTIIVAGASGVVGVPLVAALLKAGWRVYAISRHQQIAEQDRPLQWIQADLTALARVNGLPQASALIHAAPIWLLSENISRFARSGVRRLIAFSSTSVESKRNTRDTRERDLAYRLGSAEQICLQKCAEHGLALTIFRPTLVYGYGRDRNISAIASFISRYRFFAVAGAATGKRQPVHAKDLVMACLTVIDHSATIGMVYNLSGGEVLTYRKMVDRVFQGLGKRSRIITVPVPVYRAILRCAWRRRGHGYLSPDIADRMNQDLCFSHERASNDFGYKPAKFLTDPECDLRPNRCTQ